MCQNIVIERDGQRGKINNFREPFVFVEYWDVQSLPNDDRDGDLSFITSRSINCQIIRTAKSLNVIANIAYQVAESMNFKIFWAFILELIHYPILYHSQ